ncbi:hypothetical protein BaRGS_00027738 [Batillaria attramentaria]|uniref:Uncharacterized protein n=1 Tax=Batillaria attramentaria TaxID=370345 RepID=A0ABD0K1V3_9CAEN
MPSAAENLEAIESTLKASLSQGKQLDQNVVSAAQRVLLHNIEFVPATSPHSVQLSSLKTKYVLLQPGKSAQGKKSDKVGGQGDRGTPVSAGRSKEHAVDDDQLEVFCNLRQKHVHFGSRGFVAIRDHIERPSHQQRVAALKGNADNWRPNHFVACLPGTLTSLGVHCQSSGPQLPSMPSSSTSRKRKRFGPDIRAFFSKTASGYINF